MSEIGNVDSILSQIRAIRQQASGRIGQAIPQPGGPSGGLQEAPASRENFNDMLTRSVNTVSEIQKSASGLAAAFERGDKNVSLAEVMVASQKADVSFTAMVEVRNKVIDAYQEVMRMSV